MKNLDNFAQRSGASLFMLLLTAYKTLIFRYSDEKDIIVGTPVSGRTLNEVENTLGVFINMLVLRTDINDSDTFWDILQKIKVQTLEAIEHQDYPFDELVNKIGANLDNKRHPIFDTMFAVQRMDKGIYISTMLAFSHMCILGIHQNLILV